MKPYFKHRLGFWLSFSLLVGSCFCGCAGANTYESSASLQTASDTSKSDTDATADKIDKPLSGDTANTVAAISETQTDSASARNDSEDDSATQITLTLMTNGTGDHSFIDEIQKQYPDIDFKVETYPEEQYYTILKTRLATGKGPDFLFIQPGYAGSNGVKELADAGYLLPVTEEFQNLEEGEITHHALISDQDVYGISLAYMMLGVVYNRSIFEDLGLSVPTCWEEFLLCCQNIKESGISPIAFAGQDPMSYQFGIYQIAVNQLYSKDPTWDEKLRNGETAFTDPGSWDTILNTFLSLYKAGYIREASLVQTSQEAQEEFSRGDAAMYFSISSYARQNQQTDDFGFFPLPANKRGEQQYICAADLGGIGIYSGTAHPELCKKLMTDIIWKKLESSYSDFADRKTQVSYQDLPALPFCNQGWPNEVEIVMEKKLQQLLTNSDITVPDITEAMQANLMK